MLLESLQGPCFIYHLEASEQNSRLSSKPSCSGLLSPPLLLVRRCGGPVWSGHPHRFHRRHRVRADRTDLPHPSRDDRGDPGQRRGPVSTALPL